MTTFRAQRTDGQGWIEGDFMRGTSNSFITNFFDKNIFHEIDPSTLQIKTTKGEFKPINEVEIL